MYSRLNTLLYMFNNKTLVYKPLSLLLTIIDYGSTISFSGSTITFPSLCGPFRVHNIAQSQFFHRRYQKWHDM